MEKSKNKNGWLLKDDFNQLDDLFSKMGFGGYYDFLECLKEIGSSIGAFTVEGGEIDRMDVKNIMKMHSILSSWGYGVSEFRRKNPGWDEKILNILRTRNSRL